MLPTLNGVFPQPKTRPKRDFLRENKQMLKDARRRSYHNLGLLEKEQKYESRKQLPNSYLQRLPKPAAGTSVKRTSSGCSCLCEPFYVPPCSITQKPSKKPETSSREVQTDDIFDQEFLYDALKRLSSHSPEREDRPVQNAYSTGNIPRSHCNDDEENINLDRLVLDAESPDSPVYRGKQRHLDFHKPNNDIRARLDVRLPRYLEKEKKEKELKKQLEAERDRNCPVGYEPISENERQCTLKAAENKFKSLVDELNRMPMTTETLRLRSRKAEIERELSTLENEIQIFSKPKLYRKISPQSFDKIP